MLLYIALGSAAGGVLRFLVGNWVQRGAGAAWPVGTLAVNVTGSLLLGVLVRWAVGHPGVSAEMRALLAVGLCGGYTTFSTFAFEAATLLERGDWPRAAAYAAASVVLSVVATFAGFGLGGALGELRGR